jgi:hypothetical protein
MIKRRQGRDRVISLGSLRVEINRRRSAAPLFEQTTIEASA